MANGWGRWYSTVLKQENLLRFLAGVSLIEAMVKILLLFGFFPSFLNLPPSPSAKYLYSDHRSNKMMKTKWISLDAFFASFKHLTWFSLKITLFQGMKPNSQFKIDAFVKTDKIDQFIQVNLWMIHYISLIFARCKCWHWKTTSIFFA